MKLNGYQAQDRRRDDNFRSRGVTAKDVRSYLLKSVVGLEDHGILLTTIRYLFVPVNKRLENVFGSEKNVFDSDTCLVFFNLTVIFCFVSFSFTIRYKSLIACKVPKKQNNQRK